MINPKEMIFYGQMEYCEECVIAAAVVPYDPVQNKVLLQHETVANDHAIDEKPIFNIDNQFKFFGGRIDEQDIKLGSYLDTFLNAATRKFLTKINMYANTNKADQAILVQKYRNRLQKSQNVKIELTKSEVEGEKRYLQVFILEVTQDEVEQFCVVHERNNIQAISASRQIIAGQYYDVRHAAKWMSMDDISQYSTLESEEIELMTDELNRSRRQGRLKAVTDVASVIKEYFKK